MNNGKNYSLALIEELMSGNKDSIKKIVEAFIKSIPPTLQTMQDASEKGDWVSASKAAHSLKSNIDTLQMVNIHDDIKNIEINGKNGIDLDTLPALVTKVSKEIETAIQQLKLEFSL